MQNFAHMGIENSLIRIVFNHLLRANKIGGYSSVAKVLGDCTEGFGFESCEERNDKKNCPPIRMLSRVQLNV